MYLLDTNIIIYLLQGSLRVKDFLDKLDQNIFTISIVSRLEVLMGADKTAMEISELEEYLDLFKNINCDL